jgi:hypothetical protein
MRQLLAFVALLALATPSRGQELDSHYPRGEFISSGDYKGVFAVEGQPDLVLAIAKWDDETPASFMKKKFAQEKSWLDELARNKIYVPEVVATGTYEGRAAMVLKRYLAGSKSDDWERVKWDVLNERSILELKKIERGFLRSGLEIQDFQVLVDKDGHVAVFDPEKLGKHVDSPSDVTRSISGLVRQAEAAIAWRKLAAEIKAMPGALEGRFKDFFGRRVIVPASEGVVGQKALVDAVLFYLEDGKTTDAARSAVTAVRAGTVKLAFQNRWEGLGEGEALLGGGATFPELAAELVRNVTKHLGGDGQHAAQELLVAKEAPAGITKTFEPSTAIGAARTAGAGLDRSVLVDRTRTPGVNGALGDLVRERAEGERDAER